MTLRYRVMNRHGTPLAEFAHEDDACDWARRRAASTYQTPQEVFGVYDMKRKVVGRHARELVAEFDSKRVDEAPKL